MKKIISYLFFVLLLSACSLESLFQGPHAPGSAAEQAAFERKMKEHEVEIRKSLPGSFSINPRDYSRYTQPINYDESCLTSTPYLAENGDPAYAGMNFSSLLLESEIISESEATSKFLMTLYSVNIENHIVYLGNQTVEFVGEDESSQVLDPQIWINKGNEIGRIVPDTVVRVTYIVNPEFDPDVELGYAKPWEAFYWINSSATCQTVD